MIRSNLMLMLWGVLLVVVDIKLYELDVLVDPVGYALILGALTPLGRIERSFATARPFAVGALLVSIPAMVGLDPFYLTSFAGIALELFLTWHICTGILRLATMQGNLALTASAMRQRTLTLAVAGAALVTVGASQIAQPLAVLLAIPTVAFALVVMTLELLMLRRAALELHP